MFLFWQPKIDVKINKTVTESQFIFDGTTMSYQIPVRSKFVIRKFLTWLDVGRKEGNCRTLICTQNKNKERNFTTHPESVASLSVRDTITPLDL